MHNLLRLNQPIILIYLNRLLILLIVFSVSFASPVKSRDNTSGIFRDTEVENIIKFYADPIFKAAGLSEKEIKIYLVKDNSLNAFVTSNKSLFITSGLLTRSQSLNEIIGVIAHETGHIAGGHLTSVKAELNNAEFKYLLATALGALVGVASKDVKAANMIIQGGKALAFTEFLRYSRSQESSADTAAIKYLEKTKLINASAEKIPVKDNSFDYYSISFGIRNVTNINFALNEAFRFLKPSGRLMCLEFSKIENEILDFIYKKYSKTIPYIGKLVVGSEKPYKYLVESIEKFYNQESLVKLIEKSGFSNVEFRNLSNGIAAIHSGWKI